MSNEEKILEMLAALQQSQATLQQSQVGTQNAIAELREIQQDTINYLVKMDERLTSIEGTVARIENDHGAKLGALHDGYIQNAARLDRIEAEVSKHEEVILRRLP